jgi:glycosyltransferase involved in cell wall biosynthesis
MVVGHASRAPIFGAERSFIDTLACLRRIGCEVHAVLPHDNPTYFEAALEQVATLTVFEYPWWRDARALDEDVIAQFVDLIEELNIEVVHTNTIMVPESLEAARRAGVTAVVHVRENITEDADLAKTIGLDPQEIVNQVRARADHVIGNSESAVRTFGSETNGYRVYNCVDLDELNIPNAVMSSQIRVGLISSNVPKKGLADFVRLAVLAEQNLPQLRFVLIGPVTESVRNLEQLAGITRRPANLEVAGYVSDPRAALESVNVVMNLSHFAESFGRTVAEAMAAGRPVIVYDHGALPELVQDRVDGYVIPYQQFDAALDPLRELCEQPSLIGQMGGMARQRATAMFSMEAMAESLEAAYTAITSRPSESKGVVRSPAGRWEPDAAVRAAYFLWHFPVPSETFVLNEMRTLLERGTDIRVYCRRSPHPGFDPNLGIDWETVETPAELARHLELTERTIVHAHFTYPTVTDFVWPACESAGVDFTFIAHAQDIFRYDNAERNRIAEISKSKFCRNIFVLGRFHYDYLVERGVEPQKLVILPQSSDADLLRNAPAAREVGARYDRRRICAVQRFAEKKGLRYLVDAAPALDRIGVTVDIYGYGELETKLREAIKASGVSNVHLHGTIADRDELVRVFAEHDLLVAPSVRAANGDMDGIPTVLLEAMGTGLPVLASRVSSIPDLVQDGVNGLLVNAADAEGLAAQVERFYSMPAGRVRALAENAVQTMDAGYRRDRIADRLLRHWTSDTIDVVIVSYNNLSLLQAVIERLFRYTRLPFRLIVCDNNSEPSVVGYLRELAGAHENVTVIERDYNSYVGPGTNAALEAGTSRYAIYVCGKEGFAVRQGWEAAMVDYMDEHPDVGLAGTLGYSPSYMTGHEYVANHPRFADFRNREFAVENPDRAFRHVQGGVFIIRRSMYEEIGGFSTAIPHDHTDTEYSYYAESCGWRLGRVPSVLSLYNTTRPGLASRLDESAFVIHAGTPALADFAEKMADDTVVMCNLCEWRGDAFQGTDGRETCPSCGSEPRHRSVYRFLAESTLTHRGLRALYVNPHPSLTSAWMQLFRGVLVDLEDLERDVGGVSDGAVPADLDAIYVDDPLDDRPQTLPFLAGRLRPSGVIVLPEAVGAQGLPAPRQRDMLQESGLRVTDRIRFQSRAVRFDWRALLVVNHIEKPLAMKG